MASKLPVNATTTHLQAQLPFRLLLNSSPKPADQQDKQLDSVLVLPSRKKWPPKYSVNATTTHLQAQLPFRLLLNSSPSKSFRHKLMLCCLPVLWPIIIQQRFSRPLRISCILPIVSAFKN